MKHYKIKKNKENRSILILNTRGTLTKPKAPLVFISKIHKIIPYEETISSSLLEMAPHPHSS